MIVEFGIVTTLCLLVDAFVITANTTLCSFIFYNVFRPLSGRITVT